MFFGSSAQGLTLWPSPTLPAAALADPAPLPQVADFSAAVENSSASHCSCKDLLGGRVMGLMVSDFHGVPFARSYTSFNVWNSCIIVLDHFHTLPTKQITQPSSRIASHFRC